MKIPASGLQTGSMKNARPDGRRVIASLLLIVTQSLDSILR